MIKPLCFLVVILSIALGACFFDSWKTGKQITYLKNNRIENEYLIYLVNESRFDLSVFKKQLGQKIQYIEKENTYHLNSDSLIDSKFFLSKGYDPGMSNFHKHLSLSNNLQLI